MDKKYGKSVIKVQYEFNKFFAAVDCLINNVPNMNVIEIAVSDTIWEKMKKHPNFFTRGGHVYCNYKDKIFFVKRMKFYPLEGYKTVQWKDDFKEAEAKAWNYAVEHGLLEQIYAPQDFEIKKGGN